MTYTVKVFKDYEHMLNAEYSKGLGIVLENVVDGPRESAVGGWYIQTEDKKKFLFPKDVYLVVEGKE